MAVFEGAKPSPRRPVVVFDNAVETVPLVPSGPEASRVQEFPETHLRRVFSKIRTSKDVSRSELCPTRVRASGIKPLASVAAIGLLVTFAFTAADALGESRGYMTTPPELAAVAQKAAQGIQPYNAAKDQVLAFAGSPSYWPYGGISGEQSCSGTLTPSYIGNGAPLIFAKAMAYHLTGDSQYAAEVRSKIMDLTDTYGYGTTYSGGNPCILNLVWYIPSWIMAADLIQDYSGWSLSDQQTFQHWLASEIYKKVDWASDSRTNNWGSAGSATSGMIADYLANSGILLTDRDGNQVTPEQAYAQAKQRQLDRMNGNSYMDNYNCHQAVGIRPDGGIPEELQRGTSGCSGLWIKDPDGSWTWTMTHLQGTLVHAELLLRRGDPSLYNNITGTGTGSIRRAILFLLHNPNDSSKSVPWKVSSDGSSLELAYRFYRDPYMAQQLGIGSKRGLYGKGEPMLHFGTITHGFAVGEVPAALPTVPPPQSSTPPPTTPPPPAPPPPAPPPATSTGLASVTLSWSSNGEPDLAGYKVYYGTASHTYGNPVVIGLQTTYKVPGLGNRTYYFAVTAYDTSGNESGFSREVSKTAGTAPPATPAPVTPPPTTPPPAIPPPTTGPPATPPPTTEPPATPPTTEPPAQPSASSTLFVPIVLSAKGLQGSFFTSEMTLTNRGSQDAEVQFTYQGAPNLGGGGGSALTTLAAGRQVIVPDVIAYLKSLGISLPDAGDRGGTLSVNFSGLSSSSDVAITVRITTTTPTGRTGLAYTGIARTTALVGPSYLYGLRQNSRDRSNAAFQNVGVQTDGNVTLRVTVYSGHSDIEAAGSDYSRVLPDIVLPPGGFFQISGILQSNGVHTDEGYLRVERVSGTAPYHAYAVINDQFNSDGSFIPAVPEHLIVPSSLILPAIVETGSFASEVILTNSTKQEKHITLNWVSDSMLNTNKTTRFQTVLYPGEQQIIPNFVQYLRDQGVEGIGPVGGIHAGAAFLTADSGDLSGVFVAARTSTPGDGGRYGVFYSAVPAGAASLSSTWICGLRQDENNRTNLALVNTGDADGNPDVFLIELFDGETGLKAGPAEGITVKAKGWKQMGSILTQYAPGIKQGYARVTRSSGSNPFIVYAVINDGARPGERTGDGAFIASWP